jgi:hypothetical protein
LVKTGVAATADRLKIWRRSCDDTAQSP